MTRDSSELPIVIISAGPVGLAAAAHLVDKSAPLVLEIPPDEIAAGGVLAGGRLRPLAGFEHPRSDAVHVERPR